MTAPLLVEAARAVAQSPYVGLVPYTEADQAFFFGRARDTDLLVDNVIAFPITIMYGPSGVGKSSLVSAGVIPALIGRAQPVGDGATGDRIAPVAMRAWRDDPRSGLALALTQAARASRHVDAPPPLHDPLWRHVVHWSLASEGDLCVVLDQFEEYFLYHDDPDDPFIRELARAVGHPEARAHYLIAVREDSLAKLDRLQEYIPNLFDNVYRLEHLRADEARAAIVGPIDEYNRRVDPAYCKSIEPALVDAVLSQVRAGQVQIGSAGEGQVRRSAYRDEIETAHLQLVMTRLWDSEAALGSSALRLGTLLALGGADRIVRSHLGTSMAALSEHDRDLAARVFRQLVTPSGTKIAHRVDDLAAYAQVPSSDLSPVLERLSAGDLRILRPIDPSDDQPDAPRYEIFHDALGAAVLEWGAQRDRESAEREAEAEIATARSATRRARRRLLAVAIVALLLVGLLAATVVQSLRSSQEASRRRSEQLASQALAQVESDPTTAARSALAAWEERHTTRAEEALRLVAPQVYIRRAFSAHANTVTDAEFSPDGTTILTTSDDGTARLWDADTGEAQTTLSDHADSVFDGQFSDDGLLVMTASTDQTIRLWEADTGRSIGVFGPRAGPIVEASLSPDASRIASVHEDGTVLLWDVATGGTIGDPIATDDASITAVAFAPVGAMLATGDDRGSVELWSSDTGESLGESLDEACDFDVECAITDVAFNSTGDTVAIGNDIADLFIWRWDDRQGDTKPVNLWAEPVGYGPLYGVQFTPDDTHVIAVTDKQGVLFPLPTEAVPEPIPIALAGHDDWANDIVASGDGSTVVTVSADGSGMVRDGQTGALLHELRGHRGAVSAVDVTDDGQILTAGGDGTVRLWQSPSTIVFHGHTDWVLDAVATPNGQEVVTAGSDGTVRVWSVSDAAEVARLEDAEEQLGRVNRLAVSADGRYIAAGDSWGTVRVWDRSNPAAPLHRWSHNVSIFDLEFDPTGSALVIGSVDGSANIWRWDSDEPLTTLAAAGPARSGVVVAWSRTDPTLVATGTSDGAVRLWDTETSEQIDELTGHAGQISDLAIAADGRRIASASSDGTARIWAISPASTEHVLRAHEGPVTSVAFNEDGTAIVTGDSDGTVGVWDTSTGDYQALWRTHDNYVNSVAYLPDGRVLSAGDDRVARLYECVGCRDIDRVVDDLRERIDGVDARADRSDQDTTAVIVPPGTCLPSDAREQFTMVDPVACDQPHGYEVFGNLTLTHPIDADEPPDLYDRAVALCTDRFLDEYLGSGSNSYDVEAFIPTPEAWSLGSRSVTCVLVHEDGDTTGSAQAGRDD
jgi:WD40 repeat protein